MLQSKIGRNFLILFVLLNVIVVGGFVFAVMKRPDLLHAFPGQYGSAASPDLTGNMLFLALLLLMNAGLFLIFGLGGTWHALWAGLRISPRKLRWLLHDRSGLASDISGVVAEAVQEEEKSELGYLGTARGLLFVGLLLLIAALPAVCIAYAKAAPAGAAMFETGGTVVANSAISQDAVLRFTADQLAGGLLLDVPEIFHLRATPMETNSASILFALFVLLYRTLVGFGVLVWFIATRRIGALRNAAMEVAFAASEIVAMEPVLQDGHGHSDHDHHHEDHHGHDDHGHSDHGHGDHGHDDHGHDSHGHDDHGHGDHGHDDHGHTDHGHDDHGHDDHGHGDHHAADTAHDDADDESDEDDDDSESSGDSHGHDTHDHHDSHGHDSHGHDNHGHAEQSHGRSTHHHSAPSDHGTPEHKTAETV